MTTDDFTSRELRVVNKRVHRLGLELNMGLDAERASTPTASHFTAHVNEVYWSN